MDKHRTPEQQEAAEQAKKWRSAAQACSAATLLAPGLGGLGLPHLSRLTGLRSGGLAVAIFLLMVLWLAVGDYCQRRAGDLRLASEGKRPWREQKQDFEAELAQAEEYLGIERKPRRALRRARRRTST